RSFVESRRPARSSRFLLRGVVRTAVACQWTITSVRCQTAPTEFRSLRAHGAHPVRGGEVSRTFQGVRPHVEAGVARSESVVVILDPAHCYEAVLSRDRRFDGRFFAGVVTTGVYCRPICPVRPAKPENVRWFACAAAAEAAGFRPCRRCRPETAPGTPAWTGTAAVVSRALRLIAAGALDDGGVDGLADRLGVGTRQLRRLFAEHLGASPARVARARRVHFARTLIDETDLPMAEV